MNTYALIDTTTNTVVNLIVWDGGDDWTPPTGQTPVQVTDSMNPAPAIGYGATETAGAWTFTAPASSCA